jgi:excisionase family DNA binding protein
VIRRYATVAALESALKAPLAARVTEHRTIQGSAVVISPLQRRLSTTEAGDLLGVSRQYLTRLIDKGEITCDRTGRHRRLKLSDVLDYKRRRDEARGSFLDDLTAESAEAGYYD